MTSTDEGTSITFDYLKGKRRAEKALGFLTAIGSELLACDTRQQVAQVVAEHLIRLNIDFCIIEQRPHSGSALSVSAQAADLADTVSNITDVLTSCRLEAERLAPGSAAPLELAATSFYVRSNRVLLRQFSLNHVSIGFGTLTVIKLRAEAPEFTSAELALLGDVAARFLTTIRCLPS